MKRLFIVVVAVMFAISISTTILHLGSLYCILLTPKGHDNSKLNESFVDAQEFPWRSAAQVSLEFKNNLFHITSDKEWAALQAKLFRFDAQSNQTYVISMHQQLHCLNVVRVAYLSYHAGRPKLTAEFYEETEACLEQIRQHIMCNADMTLEPTILVLGSDGLTLPGATGSDVSHTCRDWLELDSAIHNWDV